MYPAHTQLLAKWSSPSIGDQRATGCEGTKQFKKQLEDEKTKCWETCNCEEKE